MPWMLALLVGAPSATAGVQLDRVEVVADDPGVFLTDELPLVAARPATTGLRLLAQVQPVVRLAPPLTLGVSLSALTPAVETPPGPTGFGGLVALPTRLGLPSGLVIAGTYRRGPLWVDLGLRASSGATWLHPRYGDLRVGPTLGIGWVPRGARAGPPPDAPSTPTAP